MADHSRVTRPATGAPMARKGKATTLYLDGDTVALLRAEQQREHARRGNRGEVPSLSEVARLLITEGAAVLDRLERDERGGEG